MRNYLALTHEFVAPTNKLCIIRISRPIRIYIFKISNLHRIVTIVRDYPTAIRNTSITYKVKSLKCLRQTKANIFFKLGNIYRVQLHTRMHQRKIFHRTTTFNKLNLLCSGHAPLASL